MSETINKYEIQTKFAVLFFIYFWFVIYLCSAQGLLMVLWSGIISGSAQGTISGIIKQSTFSIVQGKNFISCTNSSVLFYTFQFKIYI